MQKAREDKKADMQSKTLLPKVVMHLFIQEDFGIICGCCIHLIP